MRCPERERSARDRRCPRGAPARFSAPLRATGAAFSLLAAVAVTGAAASAAWGVRAFARRARSPRVTDDRGRVAPDVSRRPAGGVACAAGVSTTLGAGGATTSKARVARPTTPLAVSRAVALM